MSDMQLARKLKNKMKDRRSNIKGTLKEICILIDASKTGNYDIVYKTKLYCEHSAEYCEYLELIYEEFKAIQAA